MISLRCTKTLGHNHKIKTGPSPTTGTVHKNKEMIKIIIQDYFHSEVAVLKFNQSIQDADDGFEAAEEISGTLGYDCIRDEHEGWPCLVITEVNVDNSDDEAARDLKQLAAELSKEFIL